MYSCHFSLSDESHIQDKQQGLTIHYFLINVSLLQGPRDHQKFGGSWVSLYVMDHDMNVQIHVRILLGYLQLVYLGD